MLGSFVFCSGGKDSSEDFYFQIGNRSVNKTWEFSFPHFPVMPYNRYRFTLAITKSVQEVLGVFVVDGEAVPKL